MNIRTKRTVKGIVIFICAAAALVCFVHFFLGVGSCSGTSFETYRSKVHSGGSYSLTELPKGASDFRFRCRNLGMGADSCAAFTLSGADLDEFVASVSGKKQPEHSDGLDFVGKKVSETMDIRDEYGYNTGFPDISYNKVIDDSIEDYLIIYYDSYHGAGSRVNAVVVNPDTGRVVIVDTVTR